MLNSYYNSWTWTAWEKRIKPRSRPSKNQGYSGIKDSILASWDGPHLPKKPETILDKLHPIEEIKWALNIILELWSCPITNVFGVDDKRNIVVKSPENSEIMRCHLDWIPLVPWVVQKWLLLELNKSSWIVYGWITCLKTTFGNPILPWNAVKLWSDQLQLQNEEWKTNVKIEVVPKFKPDINFDYEELEEQSLLKDRLDRYLLQTWDFRFVSWFTWIYNEVDSRDPQSWDMFQWYFDVPNNLHFFQEKDWQKIVPPYLLEEFAAQIWSISMWDKFSGIDEEWKYHESERKILTFNSSVCQFSWEPLHLWDSFKLVWRIKTMTFNKKGVMRTATLEYVWFDSDLNEVISWEITGNVVTLETLKYGINKSLKK